MAKKKLLMVLGAGSSIPLGIPSVTDLDRVVAGWAAEWARGHGFQDYYAEAWRALDTYYAVANTPYRPSSNFEKVLGQLVALSHWMTPSPLGDAFRQVAAPGLAPPGLEFPAGPYGATVTVGDQLAYLLTRLARHMREQCHNAGFAQGPAFAAYRTLLDEFRSRFDVGIFNLNYDTGTLTAWPEAFTGFAADGNFNPEAVHGRREWDFAYHLHGSVHHSLVGEFGDAMRWERDLSAKFHDGHTGLATDHRSDNRSFPKTTLIAGGFKLDQLLIEPFQSLYADLVRRAHQADAIAIGGYGFGDTHVNRALQNRLSRTGRRPPVAVLTRSALNADPMEFRNDEWATSLRISLHAPSGYAEPGHPSPPVVAELAAAGGFEVCGAHKVALWHGGYVEAAGRSNELASWLAGDAPDSALASVR